MKSIYNMSKALCVTLAVSGVASIPSYAEPGQMEAINSASSERRNIIGIEISNLTPEQRQVLAYEGDGVYVSAVIPKHPADVAGIKMGDIITKIGDFTVEDMSSALENMDGLEAGQKSPFDIVRMVKGKAQKQTVWVLVEKVQERAIGKIS